MSLQLLPNRNQSTKPMTPASVPRSNRLAIMSMKSHGKGQDIFQSNLGNNCPKNLFQSWPDRWLDVSDNNKPKMTSKPNVSQKPTAMASMEFEDLMSLLGRFWTLRKSVSHRSQWTINVIIILVAT
jgi:hypothetical protein